jgi:hypothetical protein
MTEKSDRNQPWQFQKGTSGNPSGKPKGARNRTTLLAEKLMQDDAAQIVQAVLDAAKAGDMTAAKMIVDRIAPVRKGAPLRFDLPEAKTAGDLAAAMGALVKAMADGELSPDEAATAAGVLELRRRALEAASNVSGGVSQMPEHVRQFMRVCAYHCGNWQPGERAFDALKRAINLDEIEPSDAWRVIFDAVAALQRDTGLNIEQLDGAALAAMGDAATEGMQ